MSKAAACKTITLPWNIIPSTATPTHPPRHIAHPCCPTVRPLIASPTINNTSHHPSLPPSRKTHAPHPCCSPCHLVGLTCVQWCRQPNVEAQLAINGGDGVTHLVLDLFCGWCARCVVCRVTRACEWVKGICVCVSLGAAVLYTSMRPRTHTSTQRKQCTVSHPSNNPLTLCSRVVAAAGCSPG